MKISKVLTSNAKRVYITEIEAGECFIVPSEKHVYMRVSNRQYDKFGNFIGLVGVCAIDLENGEMHKFAAGEVIPVEISACASEKKSEVTL